MQSRSFQISLLILLGPMVHAVAQAPSDIGNWSRLKALPAHTKVHVSGDQKSKVCLIDVVDDTTLQCSKGHSQYSFARAEVKSVKQTRYAVSTLVGAGIGAGVGAAVGLGVTQDKNGWFNGDIRGVLAAIGGVVGGAAMGPTDVFRGPTIYRRGAKN